MIKSSFKDIEIPKTSIFDFILPEHQQSNDKTVFIDSTNDNSLTISQLRKYSLQLAYGLRKYHNIGKSDKVLIYSPNSIAYPILLLGTSAAGACVSPANHAYNEFELSHQIEDSEASFIFAHPDNMDLAIKTLKEIGWPESKINERVVSATEESFGNHVPYTQLLCDDIQRGIPEKFDGDSAHDVALICYSSGTTGASKGVMTTHRNFVANLCQSDNTRAFALQVNDVTLTFLPFCHIFGILGLLYTLGKQNVTQVLLPRFSLDAFGAVIEKYGITATWAVPPILNSILKTDIEKKFDFSSLRVVHVGATPLGADLTNSFSDKLEGVVAVSNGYGLTETSPLVCKLPLEYTKTHPSYIGKLVCNTTARLVDENGQDVPGDNKSSGELWVKGPQVMKGYLNRPDATAESMTSDGFFKTGDIAIYDSKTRLFKVVDRMKELIKYKGFQVTPAPLEALIMSNTEVMDAAVIGVYDDKQATELPRAYVVPQHASNFNNEAWCAEIGAWVADTVANHSKLRGGVCTIDVIPKTASGKILRKNLRTLAAQ